MPTYRYFAPNDPQRHEVIAESYERKGDVIGFDVVTSFDGKTSPPWPRGVIAEKGGTLRTHITGDVEVVG